MTLKTAKESLCPYCDNRDPKMFGWNWVHTKDNRWLHECWKCTNVFETDHKVEIEVGVDPIPAKDTECRNCKWYSDLADGVGFDLRGQCLNDNQFRTEVAADYGCRYFAGYSRLSLGDKILNRMAKKVEKAVFKFKLARTNFSLSRFTETVRAYAKRIISEPAKEVGKYMWESLMAKFSWQITLTIIVCGIIGIALILWSLS